MKANEYKSRMLSSLVMQGLDVDGLVGARGVGGWVGSTVVGRYNLLGGGGQVNERFGGQ